MAIVYKLLQIIDGGRGQLLLVSASVDIYAPRI
jgi:hypothetical protein